MNLLRNGLDTDVSIVVKYFGHLFPDFSLSHFTIYKLLWRIDPLTPQKVIQETGISKTTTYEILKDLTLNGLVNKTNFDPIAYYAIDPIKTYHSNLKKFKSKLEKGREKLENLIKNPNPQSKEIYLIQHENGQQKLFLKETRGELNETQQLLQIKKAAEEQLKENEKQKIKTIPIYK